MKIKMVWKSASNYGKVYDVELIGRTKSYYSSGHFMSDEVKMRFDNMWETSTETWKFEILDASTEERVILDNPTERRF